MKLVNHFCCSIVLLGIIVSFSECNPLSDFLLSTFGSGSSTSQPRIQQSQLIQQSQGTQQRRLYDCRNPDALRFRCRSGECIEIDRACDGPSDCPDGSDETEEECATRTSCPGLSFRCDYGACIDSKLKCDGKRDCVDGSDESRQICPSSINGGNGGLVNNGIVITTHRPNVGVGLGLGLNTDVGGVINPQSGCQKTQYRCADSRCIDATLACDGKKDCQDGSDETYTNCYAVNCPKYAYKCKYGGCVNQDAPCNGVPDCADGSDEDTALCRGSGGSLTGSGGSHTGSGGSHTGSGGSHTGSGGTGTSRPSPPVQHTTSQRPHTQSTPKKPNSNTKPTQRPNNQQHQQQTTYRPSPPHISSSSCVLPPKQSGGTYKVEGCDGDRQSALCRGEPGTPAPRATVLRYECQRGFDVPNNNYITVCLDEWTPPPPTCARLCPSLVSNSLELDCTYNGSKVRCDKPSLPGTHARLACKKAYRFPNGATPDYNAVNCRSDGTWDWPLYQCTPECGVALGVAATFIIDGQEAKASQFPWHTGIYSKNGSSYEQICGGSMVRPNMIVSAAHCFYNEAYEQIGQPQNYAVALGKYYRDWNAREDIPANVQKSEVARIYVHPHYRGLSLNYAQDIALIELKNHLTINAVVLPICVDWSHVLPNLRQGMVGKVVGWGRRADSRPSDTLQMADLPFVPFDVCVNEVPDSFKRYITTDKICAGNVDGTTVAKGDSGGGLVFKNKDAYFIRGIVSTGVPAQRTYSAFTNVASYVDWMTSIRSEVDNRHSVETAYRSRSRRLLSGDVKK